MKHYFSFDVEASDLYGEPFAVGWVIVDEHGREHDEGYLACPAHNPCAWVQENVLPVLPTGAGHPYANVGDAEDLYTLFWHAWRQAQQKYDDITLLTDCPFPVEAGFLREVVTFLDLPMEESPYPLLDVGSVLLAVGEDPTGEFNRLARETPAHNPVCDARQSARIFVAALSEPALHVPSVWGVHDRGGSYSSKITYTDGDSASNETIIYVKR